MTSSQASSKQAKAEQLTRELLAGGAQQSSALELLLQRARLYADLGDEDKAKADISQAAALAREDPATEAASVAAVERAFREISVSNIGDPNSKYAAHTSDAIVNSAVKYVATIADQSLGEEKAATEAGDIAEAVRVLSGRIAQSKHGQPALLSEPQLDQLVDAFHTLCERTKLASDQGSLAAEIASCVRSALAHMAVPTANDSEAKSALVSVAVRIAETWERNQTNGSFKQQACGFGAAMYTTAAFALSTHEASHDDISEIVRRSFAFCVNQLWLVGTTPVASAEEFGGIGQGILRLLTANRPLFMSLFAPYTLAVERLLTLLGQ
ncbi:hypothetical protein GGH95_005769, partial [Coemansia sp. RSA 1836]